VVIEQCLKFLLFSEKYHRQDRSATYIDMHEIHVETVQNTHVHQIQNTLYCVYARHLTRTSTPSSRFVTINAWMMRLDVQGHSRSFKVIELCSNQKAIYDFILVTNNDISFISHRGSEIQSPQSLREPHLGWTTPQSKGSPSNFMVKLNIRHVEAQ